MAENERAMQPEDLDRFFLERANTGDLDGVAALYEPNAHLALPSGQIVVGSQDIRSVYEKLLAAKTKFQGEVQPALRQRAPALPGPYGSHIFPVLARRSIGMARSRIYTCARLERERSPYSCAGYRRSEEAGTDHKMSAWHGHARRTHGQRRDRSFSIFQSPVPKRPPYRPNIWDISVAAISVQPDWVSQSRTTT